ncbi:MAG TPA: hypothetical protein VJ570_04260, partial [Holophagaceae bacterium]|nr:hypothetical protein [Holophagaceae bacterium]
RTLAYQDRIMQEAHRATGPTDTVLDGCGWALHREPAYRYWFLALNVRLLSHQGGMTPYAPEELTLHPPGAVISNGRLVSWLQEWPGLVPVVTSHYLPVLPNLWLPGLSARVDESRRRAEWTVPRSGVYRVAGSASLAGHPWFRSPLAIGMGGFRQGPGVALDLRDIPALPSGTLVLRVNDREVEVAQGGLPLRQGDRVTAEWKGTGALGLFLSPMDRNLIFQPGVVGVNLDEAFYTYYRNDA